MRPRHQEGAVEKRGNSWVLRYHEDRNINGIVKRVRAQQRIAAASRYRTEHEVRRGCAERISDILGHVNAQSGSAEDAAMTLALFIEHRYFAHCEFRVGQPSSNALHLEQSTLDGYRNGIYRVHVQNSPIAALDVRKVTPQDGVGVYDWPSATSLPQHTPSSSELCSRSIHVRRSREPARVQSARRV